MEESSGILEYWWSHKAVLAGCVLLLSALFTSYMPLIAQGRLPKLSLAELTEQCPHLRWLRWGGKVWFWGTSLVAAVLLFLCLKKADRPGNDDADGFLAAAALCLPALSAGVFALWTGVYPELERRGITNKFCRVAGSRMSWVPWTQIIAALTLGGLGLGGFFALRPN